MKQIYNHYLSWECFKMGMWRKPGKLEYDNLLKTAIEFTGNAKLYGEAMMQVVYKWKYSCEHNLTNLNINRRAWVGHAACAYKHGLPESVVRHAWGLLSDRQRYEANKMADLAIKQFELKSSINNYQLSLW